MVFGYGVKIMVSNALRSEHIRRRLWAAMLVIVLTVLLIGLPLIVSSYISYKKSSEALSEIQSLKILSELTNKVSRERAPSNNAMTGAPEDEEKYLAELQQYRVQVDQLLQSTVQSLNHAGQHRAAQDLRRNFVPALMRGRQQVDAYAATPYKQRTMRQMNDAITAMFHAWDACDAVMQNLVYDAEQKDQALSNYYTLILLLSELRDQAGRSASNIMPAVSFQQSIPTENLASSLQTQHQTQYLWRLVGVIQPKNSQTATFDTLYLRVKHGFFDHGLLVIANLVDDSLNARPYRMTGPELTRAMVDGFATVVELQNYILESSVKVAYSEQQNAKKKLIYAILMVLVSLLTVSMTMIYARKWVFGPLIQAREQLFKLAHPESKTSSEKSSKQSLSLFDAIHRLQKKLHQREALEFQLKHIAHSDSLTGVANRFALDEYIKLLEKQSSQFQNTCLIVIDIDNFKQVNDRFGHIVGDAVIQSVAESLKASIRASDLLVRYGGDEFLVLVENISLERALKIAEKIRKAVLASDLFQREGFEQVNVSISAGAAVGAESWIALLARADEALFRAKAKGKNSVSD